MPISSEHMWIAIASIPILGFAAFRQFRIYQRPNVMSGLAGQLGIDLLKVPDTAAWTCMQRTKLGKTGRDQRIRNTYRSDQGNWGLNLFDFRYTIPNRRNGPSVFHQTVVGVDCGAMSLPRFRLRPEGLLQKAQALVGFQDIDFAEHAGFSNTYFLQSENEQEVRHAFQTELLELFAANPGWTFESRRGAMICYKPGALLKPEDMKKAMLLCSQVYDLLSEVGAAPETEAYFQDLLARNRSHVDSILDKPTA